MATQPERVILTYADYVQLPDDGKRAVEVLSPTTARRDRGAKRQVYARYGVPHYWLVDPDRRELVAFVLEAGRYRQAVAARESEAFAAPPFPDLAIPLAELWE